MQDQVLWLSWLPPCPTQGTEWTLIMAQIVCDSEKCNFYVHGLLWLEAASLQRCTYNTQRAIFHVCCGVFLVVLPILLLKLSHPHPTSPQVAVPMTLPEGAKPPEKRQRGREGSSAGTPKVGWRPRAPGCAHCAACSCAVTHLQFWWRQAYAALSITSPSCVFFPLLCDQLWASRAPGFIAGLTWTFGLANGMMLHFSLEEDNVSHQCCFLFKERALITAAEFVNFITIK